MIKFTNEQLTKMHNMLNNRHSLKEISITINMSEQSIYRRLQYENRNSKRDVVSDNKPNHYYVTQYKAYDNPFVIYNLTKEEVYKMFQKEQAQRLKEQAQRL